MNDPFDHVIAESARSALTRRPPAVTGNGCHAPAERTVADTAVTPAGTCNPGWSPPSTIGPEKEARETDTWGPGLIDAPG